MIRYVDQYVRFLFKYSPEAGLTTSASQVVFFVLEKFVASGWHLPCIETTLPERGRESDGERGRDRERDRESEIERVIKRERRREREI